MSLSSPFIRRPSATTLLTIAVALAGGVAYFFLPVSPLPQVEFPTINVNASLPGASPETMASSVATPLERQFGRIAGVTEMTSTSSLGSTYDHAPVRPRPKRRRRRARRPGRDQRRARAVSRRISRRTRTTARSTRPTRRSCFSASSPTSWTRAGSTTSPRRSSSRSSPRSRASARSSWAAARCPPSASRSIRRR